ncbi:hypothetical protein [Phenylobacterium sp.]|uniref:hypothetical protein n=1 Tax=Phenylobacterium sp. TaxID=1871053 RepID=UPI0025DB7622|nr:hypothetical protein [Phenylobacterium sp.]
MKTLNTKAIFAALAAATAVAAIAAPAAAQSYGQDYGRRDPPRYEQDQYGQRGDEHRGYDQSRPDQNRSDQGRWDRGAAEIDRREAQIQRRIEVADRQGLLSHRELKKLQGGVYSIDRQKLAFSANGIDRYERAELNRRLGLLELSLEGRVRNQEYANRR